MDTYIQYKETDMLEKNDELSKIEKLTMALNKQLVENKSTDEDENPIETILNELEGLKFSDSKDFSKSKKIISEIYSIQNRNNLHIRKIQDLLKEKVK